MALFSGPRHTSRPEVLALHRNSTNLELHAGGVCVLVRSTKWSLWARTVRREGEAGFLHASAHDTAECMMQLVWNEAGDKPSARSLVVGLLRHANHKNKAGGSGARQVLCRVGCQTHKQKSQRERRRWTTGLFSLLLCPIWTEEELTSSSSPSPEDKHKETS